VEEDAFVEIGGRDPAPSCAGLVVYLLAVIIKGHYRKDPSQGTTSR